ncbi:(Fe-S)-binding protein [Nocardioides halotolerans]|uniref:(Fe-S)-binding protein n=1 Tax=Nocardioides halotolerans TaxID=433660 RepID=UPI0004198F49|nr:(Fe-S)-binding protein [Nocardioides halotolerans]
MELWVLVVGLVMLAVALPIAGRRVVFLYRLIASGQPAPDRVENVTKRLGQALTTQVVEVLGQKKLLKWSVPGAAHFFVFWAFVILGSVYLEAFGILFSRNPHWAIPVIGHWDVLGFAQDFIAVMCVLGLATFVAIRLRNNPQTLGRKSRFSGSHLGPAWFTLFMIFNVVWTMFLFRGAAWATDDHFPYGNGAFGSHAVGALLGGLSDHTTDVIEGIGLLLHIGVMLGFLIFVLNSKHLHIFVAPLNVLFGRRPKALGAVKPLTSEGRAVTLDDIEDMDESATLGVGSVEDFTWKGQLDFATCTECGRCQSQCPAWNTEKPLSPKLLIMALRDASFAKAPYVLASDDKRAGLLDGDGARAQTLTKEVERPLVGETGDDWFYMPESGAAVIDPDVLWSCVTCGACVEQCPVDIEHVDHIVDMRRYQVLVESNFPAELNQLFKGMENKGNPWNMSPTARMDWAQGLDFDVKVVGEDVESLDEVDWLFWVGCAGAYEDRQKKTTRAVAELLHMADVSFAVLGNGETCNGDQARRAGNEFVFQGLAQQNVETFKEHKVKKVVSTCAHCFNTLKNEYKDFGIELEVVHHTQLLNRLVREGKLTPVKDGAGAHQRKITYHDPCYIGRHNGVYSPPRELLQVLPGADFVEMPRNSERSFCCGAGGARMWMEENLGERINVNRTSEAVATGADQIAVGCPFCRVMLSDGLTAAIDKGEAREEVEVLDVAQMLLASVKGEQATRRAPGSGGTALKERPVETKAEPEAGDETVTEDTVTETSEASPAAKASGGGSSLFDTPADDAGGSDDSDGGGDPPAPTTPATAGGSLFDLGGDDESEPEAKAEPEEKPEEKPEASGGSLFDLEAEPEPAPAAENAVTAPAEPETEPETQPATPAADLGSGGSLFDIAADKTAEPEPKEGAQAEDTPVEPVETPAAEAPTAPSADLSSGGSLFDIAAPDVVDAPAQDEAEAPEPEPEPAADESVSAGAALSQAATFSDPDDGEEPEDGEGHEPEEKPEAEEKPKPAASGEAHTPKTDVDINESGSLFDL